MTYLRFAAAGMIVCAVALIVVLDIWHTVTGDRILPLLALACLAYEAVEVGRGLE